MYKININKPDMRQQIKPGKQKHTQEELQQVI